MKIGNKFVEVTNIVVDGNQYKELIHVSKKEALETEDQLYIPIFKNGITVEPEQNGNWKPLVNDQYNLTGPMPIEPKEGRFNNIFHFFRRMFPRSGEYDYRTVIDWFKVAYQYPKQKLPMLLLCSHKEGVGKTTFLKMVREIWGVNSAITDLQDFGQSPPHLFSKTMHLFDDIQPSTDDSQWGILKNLYTNGIRYEVRGLPVSYIPCHVRMIGTAWEERDVYHYIDNSRVLAFKPIEPLEPHRRSEEMKTLFWESIKEELPAFVHYLKNAEINTPQQSRFWFKPQYR